MLPLTGPFQFRGIMINKIHTGNCIGLTHKLPNSSIDFVFTSPPYGAGIEYDTWPDDIEGNKKLIKALSTVLFKKMKAGEKLESVYNIGSGAGFTVLEVISSLEKVAEKKLNIINAPRRAGDPAKLVASTEKIKKLGWIPKHTSIEEIISTAWNWHSKNAVR